MDPQTLDRIIKNGFKSEADVKHFFTELRVLLESIEPHDYKVAKFYSDWMLHINKKNLEGMYEYFKNLDETLNRHEILPNRREFNKQIESFTSFVELREQLKKILINYHVGCGFLVNQEEWKNFSYFLRKLILRKPILFNQLKTLSPRRMMTKFVIDDKAPVMADMEGAIYWMVFIHTSQQPLSGIIPESIGLKS